MPELESADFESYLRHVQLRSIEVESIFAEKSGDAAGVETELLYGDDFQIAETTQLRTKIRVSALVQVGRLADGEKLAEIRTTHLVEYECQGPMSEEFFDRFKSQGGRAHAMAFVREMISDISVRMGLKPIVLPLQIIFPKTPASKTSADRPAER